MRGFRRTASIVEECGLGGEVLRRAMFWSGSGGPMGRREVVARLASCLPTGSIGSSDAEPERAVRGLKSEEVLMSS